MSSQPGYYPDPSGDPTRLRYWDGLQWCNAYLNLSSPAPAMQSQVAPARPWDVPGDAASFAMSQAESSGGSGGILESFLAPELVAKIRGLGTNRWGSKDSAYELTYCPERRGEVNALARLPETQSQFVPETPPLQQLYLVAFILNLLSLVALCWLLVPLAWLIPCTVKTFRVLQGRSDVSTGYAIAELLLVNLVGGILLFVARDQETSYL